MLFFQVVEGTAEAAIVDRRIHGLRGANVHLSVRAAVLLEHGQYDVLFVLSQIILRALVAWKAGDVVCAPGFSRAAHGSSIC